MKSSLLSLKKLLGEVVIVRIPSLTDEEFSSVKVHAIEPQGIWIESQEFTDKMMERFQAESSSTTPVIFVPFEKIDFILGWHRSLALSETAFGLRQQE